MNIIVDRKYSTINSDPSLSFFALSVSAKDVHTRALAVYFSAMMGFLLDIDVPLKEDGLYAVSEGVYLFGKQMTGEYLLYIVGDYEGVDKVMVDVFNFLTGKNGNLEEMGKVFDRMSALVPHIPAYSSPVTALYRFVWEKMLHIEPTDDVDVMYLNKISLILKRSDTALAFTSLEKYATHVSDRPVLVVGDLPAEYEYVDKLVSGISYKGRLYLHPLRSLDDVYYGYVTKLWYQDKGYGVIYERIRDYLLLYVYGRKSIPSLPRIDDMEHYRLLWREMFVDPIERIEILSVAGHVLTDDVDIADIVDGMWDDVMTTEFQIRGRD